MPAVFITGTDTSVGKTHITEMLAKCLMAQGLDIGIMKPISCGPDKDNDALYLKRKLKLNDPIKLINPYSLPLPLSPYANILHKKKFNFKVKTIKKALKELEKKHDLVLVEGVGGILVPIIKDYYVVDLIRDLKMPTIIVSRAGLGTINHTLETVSILSNQNIDIIGIIMNGFKGKDLAEASNAEVIERSCNIPVMAKILWQKK